MARKLIFTAFILSLFVYGVLVGHYRIFPFQQINSVKNYVAGASGMFKAEQTIVTPGTVEIQYSFLKKLLIQKVPLSGYDGFGGGISAAGNFLYIVSNKGEIQTYDVKNHRPVVNNISVVPMNFERFLQTGYHQRNNFRMIWYRVTGVFTEDLENGEHQIFVSHNSYDEVNDCITHNVSRARVQLSAGQLLQAGEWVTLFTAEPCIDPEPDYLVSGSLYPGHISGGDIINYDSDSILITVGDYNRNGIDGTDSYAMDDSNPYGKHLLVNKITGSWSVYARGSRNPSGIYMDKGGNIWSVENGPEGGDELNLLEFDGNYGWPEVSFGYWYEPWLDLPGGHKAGTHPGYIKPVFSWIHTIAPSSVLRIEHEKFSHWHNDLMVGTMRDRSLVRLRLDENNSVKYSEKIDLGHRVRDMEVVNDGAILILTDDGFLIVIEDGGLSYEETSSLHMERMIEIGRYINLISDRDTEAVSTLSARAIYERNCSVCHNLEASNQAGPHLGSLNNREIGSVPGYTYTQVLRTDNRNWSPALLRSLLLEPEKEFPGTTMPEINLSDAEVDSLIQYLMD